MAANADTLRLFIGLPASQQAQMQYEALPKQGLQARWKNTGDLHITLRFLGDVPSARLDDIKEMLSRIRRPPFSVVVKGMDVFTKSKRDNILYGRVESVQKITALYGEVTDRMAALGFGQPLRPFTPHMTLARVKNTAGLDAYIQKSGRLVNVSWVADMFHLYQSGGLDPSGQDLKHIKLDSFALK